MVRILSLVCRAVTCRLFVPHAFCIFFSERVGESVGYQVRLESALPRRWGSITYCTTGIVLRRLIGNGTGGAMSGLDGITHVIVDEV
jgi:HrpA-like RNA helicase